MTKQDVVQRFVNACDEGRGFCYPNQFNTSVFVLDDAKGRIRIESESQKKVLQAGAVYKITAFENYNPNISSVSSPHIFVLTEREYLELRDLYNDLVGVESRMAEANIRERKKTIICVALSAIGSLMSFLYIHVAIAGSFQMQVLASISIGCAVFMFCRGLMYFGKGDNNYPVGDGEGICY